MKKNKCSFCGRDEDEVPVLLNGLNGFICSDCVKQAQIVLDEITPKNKKSKLKNFSNIKPIDIKKHLDEYVIGQDEAKKSLAVAVYNHYKRISQPTDNDVDIEKSNIILVSFSFLFSKYNYTIFKEVEI